MLPFQQYIEETSQRCNQRKPLDLLADHALPFAIETHQMESIFADINSNRTIDAAAYAA